MTRIQLLAATLLAGLWAWQPLQPALAEEAVLAYAESLTLRDRIMVDDDVVRLGDLFQESLSDGDIAVAQAPKAGQTLTLDARFLQQVARAYRLSWKPSKYQKITIGRMSQRVTAPMVRDAIVVAVQERMGSSAISTSRSMAATWSSTCRPTSRTRSRSARSTSTRIPTASPRSWWRRPTARRSSSATCSEPSTRWRRFRCRSA
jgi:hypothetical protein